MGRFKMSLMTLVLLAGCPQRLLAQSPSGAQGDQAALTDLRQFLFDPKARAAFSQGKSDATQSNQYLEAFPQWAQSELLEIVMMIASESMLESGKHVSAYQTGGAKGAMDSFSPAVRDRVNALMQKLTKDPSFNTPENLKKMHQLMPSLRGMSS